MDLPCQILCLDYLVLLTDTTPVVLRTLLSNDFVGRIIGKKGATIESIRQRSGATIRIAEQTGTPERSVPNEFICRP